MKKSRTFFICCTLGTLMVFGIQSHIQQGTEVAAASLKAEARTTKVETARVMAKAEESGIQNTIVEFNVSSYEKPQTMFASSAVNVRKGPSTEYGRIGGLSRGQEVSVTGQADSGWYEVTYGEGKAYISNLYLQKDKPAAAAGKAQSNGAGVIMVGDSRFVQMQANAGENSCVWIAQSGKGYQWFSETAIAQIDGAVGKGTKILINLGVNDPGNLTKYIELVNAKAEEWVGKGAVVYYSSVNPVWENPHVTEEQVVYFNTQMIAGLSGNVRWLDSHSYLESIGYKLVDGLHFNAETYQNLFQYYMGSI